MVQFTIPSSSPSQMLCLNPGFTMDPSKQHELHEIPLNHPGFVEEIIHQGRQAAFHQTNILAALLLQVLIMQAAWT